MCKIFAMTKMTNVKVTQELIGVVRDAVCKQSDKDGFGYALNTESGQVWGERTTNPMSFEAFRSAPTRTKALPMVLDQTNSFGTLGSEDNRAFVAHGRLSTNDVSLDNTHPFVNEQVALIHNGVVSDPKRKVKKLQTSCDTEILLKLWEKNGMEGVEKHAAGYYALAILDRDGTLHLARDSRASLFITYSATVDSYLIATTKEIICDVSKRMNWEIESIETIADDTYSVFSGNDVVRFRSIEPLGYVKGVNDYKASRALGDSYKLDKDEAYYEDEGSEYEYNDDAPVDEDDAIEYADVVSMMSKRRYR